MLYEEVFKALNKAKIKYAVAGGVAVVLYGYLRFTADLDLIIHLTPRNIDKFFDTLAGLGYKPGVPVTKEQFMDQKNRAEWISRKGMVVFSFWHPTDHLKHIDIFVKEPIKFGLIYPKLKRIRIKNISIPVLALEQLIRLKVRAGRDRDLVDVTNLRAIGRMKGKRDE